MEGDKGRRTGTVGERWDGGGGGEGVGVATGSVCDTPRRKVKVRKAGENVVV